MTPGGSEARSPAWRVASLPCQLLLGIALPLYFLAWAAKYLYYLRPVELLPTYATAWLFIAAAALPSSLVALLLLRIVNARRMLLTSRGLVACLIGIGTLPAFTAFLYCLLMWLRTFGLLGDPSNGIAVAILAAILAAATAFTRRGRELVEQARPVAVLGTTLGALSLLSIPFFDWKTGVLPPPSQVAAVGTPAHRPHILLLTIDTLSAEHMSLYGAAHRTTPMLEEFARGATTFDRAYANGNFTTSGVASILTGTRPWTHRALQLPAWPEADARSRSVPALLQRSGYRTVYVSTNGLAGAAKNGMAAYFDDARRDRINEMSTCSDRLSYWLKYACAAGELPLFGHTLKLLNRFLRAPDNLQYDPRLATEPALRWLDQADLRTPVFLWVHLLPPHSPYAAPKPWLGRIDSSDFARRPSDSEPLQLYLEKLLPPDRGRTLEARYEESLEYVDYYAGEFLRRALQRLGDNTVVVVTSDHGESFSHDYGAHCGPGLYDEITHIPLILKLPRQQQAARRPDLVEQVDIAPTLAEIAGIRPPPSWEGRSLLSDAGADKSAAQGDQAIFSMNFEENPRDAALKIGSVAVVQGAWKLVRYFGALHYPLMPTLQTELYNLSTDPGELQNRATTEPEVVQHLSGLIATELARHGRPL